MGADMKSRRLVPLVLCLVIALFAAACAGSGDSGDSGASGEGSDTDQTASEPADTEDGDSGAEEAADCPDDGEGPAKIAVVMPFSGDYKAYADIQWDTIQLAVDKVNEEGGINGRDIEVIREDSASDASEAVAVVRKVLGEEDVVAMIGPSSSPEVSAALPLITDSEIIALPTTTAVLDPAEVGDSVIQTAIVGSGEAIGYLVTAVREQQPFDRLAVVSTNGQLASEFEREAVQEGAESWGVELVSDETVGQEDQDFSAVLSKMLAEDPEAIWVTVPTQGAAGFMQQARERGYEGLFLGSSFLNQTQIFELAGGDVTEWFTFTEWNPNSDSEIVSDFKQRYEENVGDPAEITAFSALAYDRVLLAAEAMRNAECLDRASVNTAMHEIADFEGVTMVYTFAPSDHRPQAVEPHIQMMTENGTFEIVDW